MAIPDGPIRVIIASHHPLTRIGVRSTLEPHGFLMVAEADCADDAVAETLEHQPHITLLDVHLPGSGIRAARRIGVEAPGTKVVMLASSAGHEDLIDSLRAGATGYLLKDMNPDRLPWALKGVLQGEPAIPRSLVGEVIGVLRNRGTRPISVISEGGISLTTREWEVLDMMKQDLTTAEMAERMFVSKVTVRTHVSAILRKLKVSDRAAAIKLLDG